MVLVDTSALIDGRILMVAEAGFLADNLVIPRSVIAELQFLADNADHDKRSRARFGLDIIKKLQDISDVSVTILQDGKATDGVDERLIELAKRYEATIMTLDYNLAKVAEVESLQVINVNQLAQKLRLSFLPGEKTRVELVQPGQDSHQAVGYLPDGTMVVVEQASKLIGKVVEVEFIRALQTAAGKMMFARLSEAQKSSNSSGKGQKNTSSSAKSHAKSKVKKVASLTRSSTKAKQRQPKSQEDSLINLVNQQKD